MKLIKLLTIALLITTPTIALSDTIDTSFGSHEIKVVETETPDQYKIPYKTEKVDCRNTDCLSEFKNLTIFEEKTIEARNHYADFFYGIETDKTSVFCKNVASRVSTSHRLLETKKIVVSESCYSSLLDSFKPVMAFNKLTKELRQIPEMVFKLNTNLTPEFCKEVADKTRTQIILQKDSQSEQDLATLEAGARNACLEEMSNLKVYQPYSPTRVMEKEMLKE